MSNKDEALDELKSILYEDENNVLDTLEDKIKVLDFKLNNKDEILSKIEPLFDEIILKKLQEKDSRSIEIYASHLAKIINKSAKQDLTELSQSLQKVVSPAIAKEIDENKDKMIDALYPIMGGMISKYVTQAIKEMMETINKKIEQGLSFDHVKRKAKSKLTGVSETELLLDDSIDARILSLFVIKKESSLLISEAHLDNEEIGDAHMVASMASAIKDFINDWIENSDAVNEVQLLSYGNATLYIESAGSVFIIAFLDAEPDHEQRIKINTFFASIVKKYATFFQAFDGDDSASEVLTLSMEMEDYIYASQPTAKDKKKNPAKYIVIFLAVLLLGYGLYLFDGWYTQYTLEKTVLSQTTETIEISKQDGHLILEGQVASTDVIYEIEKIMKRHSKESIVNYLTVPTTYLDARFKNVTNLGKDSLGSLQKRLASLEQNFEQTLSSLQKKIVRLEGQLEGSKAYVDKVLKNTTNEITELKEEKLVLKKVLEVKNEIFSKLDKTFASEEYYNKDNHSLDFRTLTLFATGDTVYKSKAIVKLTTVFEKYLAILVEYKEYVNSIIIEGHSDSSGTEEENIVLSEKRAIGVKDYVEKLKVVKDYHMQTYIKAVGYGSSKDVVINGIEDKEASRRIEITFSLENEKILNKLGEIIND